MCEYIFTARFRKDVSLSGIKLYTLLSWFLVFKEGALVKRVSVHVLYVFLNAQKYTFNISFVCLCVLLSLSLTLYVLSLPH